MMDDKTVDRLKKSINDKCDILEYKIDSISHLLEKSIYDQIIDIINATKHRVPKIKKRMSETYIGGHVLIIDIPKKYKEFYHGSSYSVDCNENEKKCDVNGNIVTELGTGNDVKRILEKFDCEVLDIHNWDGKDIKSTHVHFRCNSMSYDRTKEFISIAKEF